MPSELLPSKRRSVGVGLLNFAGGFSTFAALEAYPFIVAYGGIITSFAIFGTVSLVSAGMLWKFVPETKGKTLQDIEREYRILAGVDDTTENTSKNLDTNFKISECGKLGV